MRTLRDGLELYPDSPWVWLTRGEVLGEGEQAVSAHRKVVELGPAQAIWAKKAQAALKQLGK